ncbi:uncharacterized protein LOC144464185 [Epinephelus lanceolatus]
MVDSPAQGERCYTSALNWHQLGLISSCRSLTAQWWHLRYLVFPSRVRSLLPGEGCVCRAPVSVPKLGTHKRRWPFLSCAASEGTLKSVVSALPHCETVTGFELCAVR